MASKINILYVIFSLEIGGLEVLLLEFLKTLNRDKYNPSVCTLSPGGSLINEFEKIDIPVYVIPKRQGIDYLLAFKLRRLIKDKQISIVHTHNSAPWLYCSFALIGLKGVRLIHTKHSNLASRKNLLMLGEKIISNLTDRIIADSKDVERFMISRQNIDAVKIKTIFNGIDTEKFSGLKRLRISRKKIPAKNEPGIQRDHIILAARVIDIL